MKGISNSVSDKSELKEEFRFTLYQNAVLPAALWDPPDDQPYSVHSGGRVINWEIATNSSPMTVSEKTSIFAYSNSHMAQVKLWSDHKGKSCWLVLSLETKFLSLRLMEGVHHFHNGNEMEEKKTHSFGEEDDYVSIGDSLGQVCSLAEETAIHLRFPMVFSNSLSVEDTIPCTFEISKANEDKFTPSDSQGYMSAQLLQHQFHLIHSKTSSY